MEALYKEASLKSSKAVTNCYSTSFSLGILALDKKIHEAIYAIYGFVRLADEIVDTFHEQDKKALLAEFVLETQRAIDRKLSLNPILNSFQWVVNHYQIEQELIDAFIKSMELDLFKTHYNQAEFEEYIYGSAEVVGLMCLRVFCEGDEKRYQELKYSAKRLGSAFQKINFLRDLKDDFEGKGRSYFPEVDLNTFSAEQKTKIEDDLMIDFQEGFQGIKRLPSNAKFGVYTAYVYYFSLFKKIKATDSQQLLKKRIRISNWKKYFLLFRCSINFRLGKV